MRWLRGRHVAAALLLSAFAGVTPLAGQTHYAEDGRIGEPALTLLNTAYRPDLEQGFCVTAWHVDGDTIVVDSVVRSADVRDAGYAYVIFDCPVGQPTIHTHPSHWPYPSSTDVREGLIDRHLPFIAVLSAPNTYTFAIAWGRIP